MLPDMVLTTSTIVLITLSFIPALAKMNESSPAATDSMIADIIYVITILLFIYSPTFSIKKYKYTQFNLLESKSIIVTD